MAQFDDLIEIPIIFDGDVGERVGSIVVHKKYTEYFPHWIVRALTKKDENGVWIIYGMSLVPAPDVVAKFDEVINGKPCKCKRKLL